MGKVGTGFSHETMAMLHARLRSLVRESSPFVRAPRERGVHFVEPALVCEVEYRAITDDGILRQASFVGLREDKPPPEIAIERPLPKLKNPDKVLYPEDGITKREICEYYARVAPLMLPEVAGRPLMFVRCPNGLTGHCFFQKHWRADMPKELRRIDFKDEPYVTLDDERGLLALAQLGALEIHTMGTRAAHPDKPDIMVLDLDPDEAVFFTQVIDAARELRALLHRAKLSSWVKTTGGKGLHVCVPLEPALGWDDVKEASRTIAEAMRRERPERYVTTMSKARRGGKIFIDYFRNGEGASFIAPYSIRRAPGAPIAAPLAWEELTARVQPNGFRLRDLSQLLARKSQQTESDKGAEP